MKQKFDKIIIGAGLYGLYAAKYCADKGENVLVLEYDTGPFMRATYINQARVHRGYHYPRSLSTAIKSAGYFERFHKDFEFCIYKHFDQIYATSQNFSWTSAQQFKHFCDSAGIRCEEAALSKYFKPGVCDGAFLTQEYTYDAGILANYYVENLKDIKAVSFIYQARISKIIKDHEEFQVWLESGECFLSSFILNATYASVNQILNKTEGITYQLFGIKYELCEIILCKPSEKLKEIGITVMDGPFFSIMPFGKTGMHSLTAVTFTPHMTAYDAIPEFPCQTIENCGKDFLQNCNYCKNKPDTAWPYMTHLAEQYLKEEYAYEYESSLFSMKPILKSSEVDDSRPTAIRITSTNPTFISVLSGKINTVYDLDPYL